jgi:hypothetical protein
MAKLKIRQQDISRLNIIQIQYIIDYVNNQVYLFIYYVEAIWRYSII